MAIRPGFELYPSNKQRMLNKDLTQFLQSVCLNYTKNFASEGKILLAGQVIDYNVIMSFKHIHIECYSFFLHQKQGASIVLDPEKDKSMVQDLLDFKEQLDSIIEDAFMRSEKFVNSMKVRTSLLPHCVSTLVYCPIMLMANL